MHRDVYAAPRSPISWDSSVRLGCIASSDPLPLETLKELSQMAKLRVWAPGGPTQSRPPAPGIPIRKSPVPDTLDLALLDVLVLFGEVTAVAQDAAIQAAASGCVLLAGSEAWARCLDDGALTVPESYPGGLMAWLPNVWSSPDKVSANRQASRMWKRRAFGSIEFVKQITSGNSGEPSHDP